MALISSALARTWWGFTVGCQVHNLRGETRRNDFKAAIGPKKVICPTRGAYASSRGGIPRQEGTACFTMQHSQINVIITNEYLSRIRCRHVAENLQPIFSSLKHSLRSHSLWSICLGRRNAAAYQKGKTLTLVKSSGGWILGESHGYPE